VLRDTWTQWSLFGQLVILLMIQIGGLGFMSAASLAYMTLRRKIGMRQQMVMAEAIGSSSMSDIVGHQRNLIARAFAVEGIGAAILTARFSVDYPFLQALKLGVFHSISAFCNAGFDILGFIKPGASLIVYQTDPVICLTLAALVIVGGLGFLVWDELLREWRPRKWSVYTRLVMITTGILLLGGTLLFCLLEWRNPSTLGPMTVPQKILAAFFQSTTLRTAGFAGVDQGMLTQGGKAVSIFMMLIGGSSGSTAGGLKTVTFVVLLVFLWHRMRGRRTVSVFHRTISDDHALNAITIFMLMVLLAFAGATLICATSSVGFADSLFETVSALGTVGLTADVTPSLHAFSQIMIIIFMFFGRVGIMTISLGFLMGNRAEDRIRYAETKLMIG
jgi:trk system potassium uptake protein TrkH